jgi:hypothetical protein
LIVKGTLALHFLGQLFAERDLFLQRVKVHALADIPAADLIRVFLLVLAERNRRQSQRRH